MKSRACLFRGLPLILALIFASFSSSSAAAGTEAGDFVRDPVEGLLETRLDNGLRVMLLEDHRTPVVAFQIWVDAGSSDEAFYTGIAHLFEHMMFKGSKNIGEEVHAQLINERGGRINAYTSRDVTVYHEDVTGSPYHS
jgi:zinc protease